MLKMQAFSRFFPVISQTIFEFVVLQASLPDKHVTVLNIMLLISIIPVLIRFCITFRKTCIIVLYTIVDIHPMMQADSIFWLSIYR